MFLLSGSMSRSAGRLVEQRLGGGMLKRLRGAGVVEDPVERVLDALALVDLDERQIRGWLGRSRLCPDVSVSAELGVVQSDDRPVILPILRSIDSARAGRNAS
jgi:hypothetical protein